VAPAEMLDTIVGGTEHVLEFSASHGTKKFLFVSSGAVYGEQPSELTHVPEGQALSAGPAQPSSAYAEGKRSAELVCSAYASRYDLEIKTARCFAFVGPGLPLGAHFAIGNFLRNRLRGERILVTGDGTPRRSYLYAADLAVWLWTILFRGGAGGCYNVGSEQELSIRELAQRIGALEPPLPVEVGQAAPAGKPAARYVPSTAKARRELGLEEWIDLESAILKTLRWHQERSEKSNADDR
jgi:nucleoside-diphosphate-sugar epimerase